MYGRLGVVLLVAMLSTGCPNPFVDGCKLTWVLDDRCGVRNDGAWTDPPPGIKAVSLDPSSDSSEQEALIALNAMTASTMTLEEATSAPPPGNNSRELDVFENYVLNNYLLHYVRTKAGADDCRVFEKLSEARTVLLTKTPDGYYRYLMTGPHWALTSKSFESSLLSAELRAEVEADFAKLLQDKAKAHAAATIALDAMSKNVSHGFVAGTYRYLGLRNIRELYSRLDAAGALADECQGNELSPGIGIVAVALKQSDSIVSQVTGATFEADIKAGLSDLSDDVLKGLKAAVAARVNAKIQTAAERTIKVKLSKPALVPLSWKASRIPKFKATRNSIASGAQ